MKFVLKQLKLNPMMLCTEFPIWSHRGGGVKGFWTSCVVDGGDGVEKIRKSADVDYGRPQSREIFAKYSTYTRVTIFF